jgi:hypothetical protein
MKLALAAILLLTGLAGAPAMGLLAVTAAAITSVTAESCAPDDPDCTPDAGAAELSTGRSVSPRVQAALRTAADLLGARSGWYRKCDKLACRMYGYYNSGYPTATVHWYRLLATGHAHPGDRCPPVGSFVFWATGSSAGHVAFVAGNDGTCRPQGITVVTNDWGDTRTGTTGGVYATTLAGIENGWMTRTGYRGWTDPICAGTPLTQL